jgi:hypothetical protein
MFVDVVSVTMKFKPKPDQFTGDAADVERTPWNLLDT